MKYSGFIVVFKLYIFGSVASEFDPIVHIHEGFIRGTTLSSIRSNLTFFAFMGIPYARPPIGELRFKVRIVILQAIYTMGSDSFFR